MRIPQPLGTKGSLKWMQRAVQHRPDLLQPVTLPPLTWVSPTPHDAFAEYRDTGFLRCLNLETLAPHLAAFWPRRGPQWDGLARFPGGVVLAEAKAHLAEFETSRSAAGPASAAQIATAFAQVQTDMNITPASPWDRTFYQYANRLAHLWWLRAQGINARLLLIGFLGDAEVSGPVAAEAWDIAYANAESALGLPRDGHALSRFIHHLSPAVSELSNPAAIG